jgi:hypothetical protein
LTWRGLQLPLLDLQVARERGIEHCSRTPVRGIRGWKTQASLDLGVYHHAKAFAYSGGREMKLKVLLVGLAASMLCVSAAVAAPPEGKGKPKTTGEGCTPKVTVVLKGTLTGAPLSVDVTSANRWGRAYVPGTASTSVSVDANTTKVRRQGKAVITELVVGDRVLVQARACKANLAEGAMPPLTAVRVVAHPAKA